MGQRIPPEEWVHGTYNTYNNRGCRCPPCVEAKAAFARVYYSNPEVADRIRAAARVRYASLSEEDRRLVAAAAKSPCPECGAPKSPQAESCWACFLLRPVAVSFKHGLSGVAMRRAALFVISPTGTCQDPDCGESDLDILEIHHVNNDGRQDRAAHGGAYQVFLAVVTGVRPTDDLEVLCPNHHAKRTRTRAA